MMVFNAHQAIPMLLLTFSGLRWLSPKARA